jgi:lipopolysaccharide/colanic/teichoic acid biosynthesis glycosyltransferase
VNLRRSNHPLITPDSAKVHEFVVLGEASLRRMIALERKRTERSGQPVLLMLLDLSSLLRSDKSGMPEKFLSALSLCMRNTDVTGWYKDQTVVGVMFTEIGVDDRGNVLAIMLNRVNQILRDNLTLESFNQIRISMHLFPEDWFHQTSPGDPVLYPDILHRDHTRRSALALKRMIDIMGSGIALLLFAPAFLLVSLLVKLGSKGPILYRQERLGQFGRPFTFLKFRSMYQNNDAKIHREFMKRVIKGSHSEGDSQGDKVYKMKNDPRITRVGRFLRRTSLDELPQFFNVLRGEMSLVGPRPPLAYECQEYDIWHRRRVFEVKPGLTGLWQVNGRSRVGFDDMVRLDLQYVREWSLWLDLKILLQTPAALFSNDAF